MKTWKLFREREREKKEDTIFSFPIWWCEIRQPVLTGKEWLIILRVFLNFFLDKTRKSATGRGEGWGSNSDSQPTVLLCNSRLSPWFTFLTWLSGAVCCHEKFIRASLSGVFLLYLAPYTKLVALFCTMTWGHSRRGTLSSVGPNQRRLQRVTRFRQSNRLK